MYISVLRSERPIEPTMLLLLQVHYIDIDMMHVCVVSIALPTESRAALLSGPQPQCLNPSSQSVIESIDKRVPTVVKLALCAHFSA